MQLIADRLSVSKVTVSKALNNQPGVGEELRKRIFEMAQDLEYLPPQERKQVQDQLTFIVPRKFQLSDENFYTTIYYELSQKCLSNGFTLQLVVIEEGSGPEQVAKQVAGLTTSAFFVGGQVSLGVLDVLVETGIPLLGIDFLIPEAPLDFVIVDNFMAGYRVTEHLIRAGHSRIGFVGEATYSSNVADRWFGYQKAMLAFGLLIDPNWQVVNNDLRGTYSFDFALPDPLPTAFVCHCDMAAYHLLIRLNQAGMAVPQDVSLVSFDNTELSRRTVPPLTSLNISREDFARVAMKQLKWRLAHPEEPFQSVLLNTHLEVRDSVRPMPSHSTG